ncbi:hypothetical protein V1477_004771 [Vespula maculifrons]|uniref:Uncharacterized protein n=1 Tax=Vespula maculifrons TaxID=7453 RepID=A0ABD2CN09_VESMC
MNDAIAVCFKPPYKDKKDLSLSETNMAIIVEFNFQFPAYYPGLAGRHGIFWDSPVIPSGKVGPSKRAKRINSSAVTTFPICLYEFFLVKIAVEAEWFYPSSQNFKKYPRIEDESDFRGTLL